jgi:hypothetical protein
LLGSLHQIKLFLALNRYVYAVVYSCLHLLCSLLTLHLEMITWNKTMTFLNYISILITDQMRAVVEAPAFTWLLAMPNIRLGDRRGEHHSEQRNGVDETESLHVDQEFVMTVGSSF